MCRSLYKATWILGALMLLSSCGKVQEPFHATAIEGSPFAMHWALTNQEGARSDGREFTGKVSVIYFGYTACPDICFTTLNRVAESIKILKSKEMDLAALQVIFISVDPETDTPKALKNYLEHFGSGFIGLTGSEAEISATIKDFKVYAEKTKSPRGFEHSGFLYVFDRQQKPRLLINPTLKAEDIAHDLGMLLSER
jgi:protein SCO1/2